MLCKILRFLLRIADATISVLGQVLELVVDAAGELIKSVGDAASGLFGSTGGLLLLGVGAFLLFTLLPSGEGSEKSQPTSNTNPGV